MNKKGIFTPLIVLFAILMLIYAYHVVILSNDNNLKESIGDKQDTLYDLYGVAEKNLFYVDVVVKYSIEKSITDLNENGGFSEQNKYWGRNSYPGVKEEFKKSFNKYFNGYMDINLDYGSVTQKVLSSQNKNNYDLDVNNGYLIGKSKEKLGFTSIAKNMNFVYFICSDFKQKLDYDFTQYDEIKQEVDDLLTCLEETKGTITDKLIKEDCGFNKGILDKNILTYNFNEIIVKVNLGEKEVSQDKTWGQSS